MNTALDQWRELIGGAFSLQFDTFREVATLSSGLWFALIVVTLAGLSLAIAQSIVLFVSRVRPSRFIFCLLLNAVLFTIGFIFLTLSTWVLGFVPGSPRLPLIALIKVLGLGYAPLLFSFLGALPYLGYPIGNLLSVWNLLAMVVGYAAIAQMPLSSAFVYIALGWFVKQNLEGTIGQPIARLGSQIVDRVAGVTLADTRQELKAQISAGVQPRTMPEVQQLIQASGRSASEAAQSVAQSISQSSATPLKVTQRIDSRDRIVQAKHRFRGFLPRLKLALTLLAMAIAFILILVLLRPIRDAWFGWYTNLRGIWRLTFDFFWISVVAIVFAGILAPLESLGWWAGWYGDPVVSAPRKTPLVKMNREVDRYIVYLDGIAQSGSEYTPDIEEFLAALKPALPSGVEFVQGLMMYSVLNRPLIEDRPLAFLWRLADKVRWANPTAVLGLLVNIRNVIIVAVSSDKRYGPIYNQGIAQVIFDGLIDRGYESGVPITLIGYSGGGEMSVAAAPYLKRSTGATIDVISIGGVMSANHNLLKLEQLYHIIGEKDTVEKIGPVMFPGRWKLFLLSYWNRAKRKGKITILSAGCVGHQVPGGYMDPIAKLPDGRSHLQQTIEMILQILNGKALRADESIPKQTSHYALYRSAVFNRPEYYPIQSIGEHYQPIGKWMGRLILPKQEERFHGVLFEVYHAPDRALIGRTVKLCWSNHSEVQKRVKAVRKDVHFSADAEFSSKYGGAVHPDRINHWKQVDPLESLAGSHPVDDIIVKLNDPVEVRGETLYIDTTPIQITGRYYALVQFVLPVSGTDQFQVIHFDRASRQFNGESEVMRLPEVVFAKNYGSYPSTTREIEHSPYNETGWYVYGAKDAEGVFVVQAIAPRALFQLRPEKVTFGRRAAFNYVRFGAWKNAAKEKGKLSSVLCSSRRSSDGIEAAIQDWKIGDKALLLHTYGGIGGNNKEPAAGTPIFFGHFAYGMAEVVYEPLADEPRFEINYYQVYTQNTDGLVAGILHWSRYLGDRQFGWLGTRPVCDILIKLNAFTEPYIIGSATISPLDMMMLQLEGMTARYRIGDGTGGTFVGPANNCSQDSNQALFASIQGIERILQSNPEVVALLLQQEEERYRHLRVLGEDLESALQSLGGPRPDWQNNEYNLGSTLEDDPLRNLWIGLGSWRTMFPRKASDTIAETFIKYGASVWVLRTNQIGGFDPDIAPIAPTTF
ncbi:hypothetical protein LEP3755_01900 [Leptolyngbya sp. NIES-3755]|nr:hypothetical protein LEP3755_01900 [Leptolyngbya sp. NIES-3755]